MLLLHRDAVVPKFLCEGAGPEGLGPEPTTVTAIATLQVSAALCYPRRLSIRSRGTDELCISCRLMYHGSAGPLDPARCSADTWAWLHKPERILLTVSGPFCWVRETDTHTQHIGTPRHSLYQGTRLHAVQPQTSPSGLSSSPPDVQRFSATCSGMHPRRTSRPLSLNRRHACVGLSSSGGGTERALLSKHTRSQDHHRDPAFSDPRDPHICCSSRRKVHNRDADGNIGGRGDRTAGTRLAMGTVCGGLRLRGLYAGIPLSHGALRVLRKAGLCGRPRFGHGVEVMEWRSSARLCEGSGWY